jgi:hypothetical protein
LPVNTLGGSATPSVGRQEQWSKVRNNKRRHRNLRVDRAKGVGDLNIDVGDLNVDSGLVVL